MRYKILLLLILTVVLTISKNVGSIIKIQDAWRVRCSHERDCPVDGGWTPWSVWSPCEGACDQLGHRIRTRDCTNPPPSRGGLLCSGPQEQIEQCHHENCSPDDFRMLVEGDPTRSEALRQLESVPALMDRCLNTDCPFEAIETALAADNTWQLSSESIWNALLCVKHNIGCPVEGEWGAWGQWSACGARCGEGFRWRLRRCDTPSPSEGRYVCSGSPLDMKPCEGDQCAIERRDARGTWADWGKWTECSESCGVGVKRRRRNCLETQTPVVSGSWGTHCRGQHDQIETCKNKQCTLNGAWSGWGPWGPCSQTCGAGKRMRSRSCTRPVPAGSGKACEGRKTEIGSCYLTPCNVHSHPVAVFNGDSYLKYRFNKETSILFHCYVRFMPLSFQGTLLQRGTNYNLYVRLSLRKGFICLEANGVDASCNLKICSYNKIEPAVWHTVMVTVSAKSAEILLDDAHFPVKSYFPCEPELPDISWDLIVGNKFYGEIQEVIVNFNPLKISHQRGERYASFGHFPTHAKNIAYEIGNLDEGCVHLKDQYIMRLPCFNESSDWQLEVTLRPKQDSGTILFIGQVNRWLHVSLQSSRLKFKLASGLFRSESKSATEYPKNKWVDITLRRMPEANSIEAIINGRERLHILTGPNNERKRRNFNIKFDNTNDKLTIAEILRPPKIKVRPNLCVGEYFIGGVPPELKNKITEEFTFFNGIIASVIINTVFYDLDYIGLERYKDNLLQISARTASVSGTYEEITWGKSNSVNLSCLHTGLSRSSNDIHWLYLDTEILDSKPLFIRDLNARKDRRVLSLTSTLKEEIRGFYTCRAFDGNFTRNIVTYGVLGESNYRIREPDLPSVIAVISSIILIFSALGWLLGEGITDMRRGHGFFRDRHMSREQVVSAICKYIDANQDLIGGTDAANISKMVARRRALNLINRSTLSAPERRRFLQIPKHSSESVQPVVALPPLPESASIPGEASHDFFRFEPNYVSTPQHGSISSPKKNLTSSSSVGHVSPRILCSRIIVAKNRMLPRESVKKNINRKNRSNLPWSPTLANKAAQTILSKFHELQDDM